MKTSTRKRVNGRKRVSKQNKLINVDRAVTTLKSTTSSTLSKFVQSYQAVAVFMFSFGMLTVLSIFSQGGPVGEVVFNVLQWAFGYGVFALPVFFFYGSAILIRDRETVKAQRVLVGTILGSNIFSFYVSFFNPCTTFIIKCWLRSCLLKSGGSYFSFYCLSTYQQCWSTNDTYNPFIRINHVSSLYD